MRKETYALITGSSTGLGRAFAEDAASRGWNLILAALPGSGLPVTANTIADRYGVDVEYFEMDLTRTDMRQDLATWIRWNSIEVDLLINNAGIGCPGVFMDAPSETISTLVELNVQALTHLTYLMLPVLKHCRGSRIINVASLAGFYPMPVMAVYAASKSYILHFSLALKEELRDKGIGVSVLCPGGIMTNPDVKARIEAQGVLGRLSGMTPEKVARVTMKRSMAGRPVIVPGVLNVLLRLFGTAFPKTFVSGVIGKRFRKAEAAARRMGKTGETEQEGDYPMEGPDRIPV